MHFTSDIYRSYGFEVCPFASLVSPLCARKFLLVRFKKFQSHRFFLTCFRQSSNQHVKATCGSLTDISRLNSNIATDPIKKSRFGSSENFTLSWKCHCGLTHSSHTGQCFVCHQKVMAAEERAQNSYVVNMDAQEWCLEDQPRVLKEQNPFSEVCIGTYYLLKHF